MHIMYFPLKPSLFIIYYFHITEKETEDIHVFAKHPI